MSDTSTDAQDASVLGKRARNNANDENGPEPTQPASKKVTIEDDSDDDDDVGPMPLPAGAPASMKKKRKGMGSGVASREILSL